MGKRKPVPDGEADSDVEIWAAGGLVVDEEGSLLLVHRPRYDDWTLPKGKLDEGETLAECAQREVHEETGYVCALGDLAATVRYVDHKSRLKEVRYWHMTPVVGSFEPNDEVDEIAWVEPNAAATLLTYDHDRDIASALD